jgi:hypothetical protein
MFEIDHRLVCMNFLQFVESSQKELKVKERMPLSKGPDMNDERMDVLVLVPAMYPYL